MNKKIIVLFLIIILFLSINSIYAEDNNTSNTKELKDHTSDNTIKTLQNNTIQEKTLQTKNIQKTSQNNTIKKNSINNSSIQVKKSTDNTCYFNASVTNDNGNGSKTNPWKTITEKRINNKTNGSIYISNGIYNITSTIKLKSNLNIIGENPADTIISTKTSQNTFYILNNTQITMSNLNIRNNTGSVIVNYGNLTLNNIKIANISTYTTQGIIYTNKGNLSINNSEFSNIYSYFDKGVINNINSSIIINNTKFINNSIQLQKYYEGIGNCICLDSGDLLISNSLFKNNIGPKYSIYLTNTTAKIYNSTFLNNNGTYTSVLYTNDTTLEINNSIFINNSAQYDGGVIEQNNTTSIINNSLFENNTSIDNTGGVIFSRYCLLTVNNSIFNNNKASEGGVICTLDGYLTIKNSNITNNNAQYDGGAIYDFYTETNINNSNFINNTGRNGGVIYIYYSINYFNITNSLFVSNHAKNSGGVIYSSRNNFTLINNSFINNTAYDKMDVYNINPIKTNIDNNNYSTINTTTKVVENTKNITISNNNITLNSTLPSKYDLRDNGYVTEVKNQGSGGNCWSFGTLASLESCILKNSNISYDLSENNMKNILALYSEHGWYKEPNTGGWNSMELAYLTSWLGPIYEYEDKYTENDLISPILTSNLHIQNIINIIREDYTDNTQVKEAILKYGALCSNIYMCQSSPYFNDKTNSHYYNNISASDHVVCVVGWDDNYSKSNFLITPPGDGAFIVKNSWGTEWGNNGYFYVSYYDDSFGGLTTSAYASLFTFILNNTDNYDNIYQNDIAGYSDWIPIYSNNAYYSNSYISKTNEVIKAFSTYAYNIYNYTAYVYVNDKLNYVQNGTFDFIGYETIKLNKNIEVNENDTFKIVLKLSTNKSIIYIPIESINFCNLITKDNQSFISNGSSWNDTNKYYYTNATACLKVFTDNIIYFDANALDDTGDGSSINPWKIITQDRINLLKNNTNILIKNGVYTLNNSIIINKNLIISGDSNKAIITSKINNVFVINSDTAIKNITFINNKESALINNNNLRIDSCYFINNTAINGSCINNHGNLVVINSNFINNTALNYGGVIYSKGMQTILKNNNFINIKAKNETLYLNSTNILLNNNYQNCSINYIIKLNSKENTTVFNTLTININTTLLNKDYYDENLINKTNYDIYINNNYIKSTDLLNYIITPTKTGILRTYVISKISNDISNNIIINVLKINTKISIITQDSTTTKPTTITIIITDYKNNPINTGIIQIKDNNRLNKTIELVNNTVSITKLYTQSNNYNINVLYTDPNNIYNLSSTDAIVVITKTKSNIILKDITDSTLNNTNINITLQDINKNKITQGTINLTIIDNANKTIYTTIKDIQTNDLIVYYSFNKEGTYKIKINYTDSNKTYESNNITSYCYIKPIDTKIIASNRTGNINQNIIISINITDINNNSLNNETLYYYNSNNTLIQTSTIINGKTNISVNYTIPGKYTIYIKLNKTETYQNNFTQISLNINGTLNTAIKLDKIIASVNDKITLTVNVTDTSNNKLTGGKVCFKVNGLTLKDAKGNVIYASVNNGKATLIYTVPSSWLSSPTISVMYSGSGFYNSAQNSTKTTINKRTATITGITLTKSNNQPIIGGDTVNLTAIIKDKNGSYVQSGYVIFKFHGKTICDSNRKAIQVKIVNGKAILSYKLPIGLSQRNYTLTAIYTDTIYTTIKQNAPLTTITKSPTTITITKAKKTTIKTLTITATLTDKNNNKLIGTNNIAIKLNGKTLLNNKNKTLIIQSQNGTLTITITLPTWAQNINLKTITLTTGERNAYQAQKTTTNITT